MPLSDKNWNGKESELQLRCAIARCYNPTATKVIGLAIGESPEVNLCLILHISIFLN